MKAKKNILISPLNWGLGHASRLIPIIDYCIKAGMFIVIGGNGASFELLKAKYPNLIFEEIPAPELKYGSKKAINIRFIFNFIIYLLLVVKGLKRTKAIVHKYQIDTIITDNRPDVFCSTVKSIYITHQVNVYLTEKEGLISKFLTAFHRKVIKKYTHCFVADTEGRDSLAGRLSVNSTGMEVQYLGPLSRFSVVEPVSDSSSAYEIVCIVSGPEPQRSIFEKILLQKFSKQKYKTLILRGMPGGSDKTQTVDNVHLIDHCDDSKFLSYLLSADTIICRSGYSTIMDLVVIGKKALLVPTPGQPEQEYLARRVSENHGFAFVEQQNLLNADIQDIKIKNLEYSYDKNTIKKTLDLYL